MSGDYQRPPVLYRYGSLDSVQKALENGEFRLLPGSHFLTLGFAMVHDEAQVGAGREACLIIHQPEEFGERLHRAVQRMLPSWAGIDGQVEYGKKSPLGAAFSKGLEHQHEHEWQFAWRPMQAGTRLQALVVKMGDLRGLAEMRSSRLN